MLLDILMFLVKLGPIIQNVLTMMFESENFPRLSYNDLESLFGFRLL